MEADPAFTRLLRRSALILVCGSFSGCSSDEGRDPGAMGSGSNGGSSNSSGSGAEGGGSSAPPTCGQACQDYLVAHALNEQIWFLWNQNLAGHPAGMQDKSASCALGGTAHIAGTNSVGSNGIDTAEMMFALDACEHSGMFDSLTFTGEVTMEGSFQSSDNFAALTFDSSSLVVTGVLDYLDDPSVEQTCPVTFAQDGTEDGTLVGQVCGRHFSSETALTPTPGGTGGSGSGGSNGSGGTSGAAGTSGGNDCRCFCPDDSDCTNSTDPNPCGLDADGIPEVCGCPDGCP